MNAHERIKVLGRTSVKSFLEGKELPPFPDTLDNTIVSTFRKCPQQCFREHFLCRVEDTGNIHLVAGAAYAAGHEAFRLGFYGKGALHKDYEGSLEAGILAIIKHYGYDEERESSDRWAASPKTCERMIGSFLDYWQQYHPKLAVGKMHFHEGVPSAEMGGKFPLDVLHPVTGKPLMYSIRFDYIENRGGQIWLGDDKTTSSLGTSWAKQWDIRSQFLGYVYGARLLFDIPCIGVIARGTGILKHSVSHMEVPISVPEFMAAKWWKWVNLNAQKMVDAWKNAEWEYDFADGCAAYGGCKFANSCNAKFEHKHLASMPIRVWNPEDPENSPTIKVEEL